MSPINDLCLRLNILPPLNQSTCIGYSQRKPTCGCTVALSSREAADRTLRDIAYDVRAGTNVVKSCLEGAASLLLCRRFHQSQTHELVVKWSAALSAWKQQSQHQQHAAVAASSEPQVSFEQYQTLVAELQQVKEEKNALCTSINKLTHRILQHGGLEYIITGGPRPVLPPPAVTISDMLRVSNAIPIAELDRRIQSDSGFKNDPTLHGVTAPLLDHSGPADSSGSHGSSRLRSVSNIDSQDISHRRGEKANLPARSRRRRAVVAISGNLSQEFSPDPEEPQHRHQSNSEAEAEDAARSPERLVSPVRHSHNEYAACFEQYSDDERESGNHWVCGACQNWTHLECFASWAEAAGSRNVRCIYCRAAVVESR